MNLSWISDMSLPVKLYEKLSICCVFTDWGHFPSRWNNI